MKSDDKPAAAKSDDRKELPPLQDRTPAGNEPSFPVPGTADVKDDPAHADKADSADEKERPMSADERRKQEREAEFAQRQKQREEENKRNAEFQRMAEKPNKGALKMWIVAPVDDQAPPFHFSNRAGGEQGNPIVFAENEEYARRMVAQAENDPVWENAEQVAVTEFKPETPMVITMAFKG